VWNAHAHHHYHLGTGPLARSTLADANARRPVALFAETDGEVLTLITNDRQRPALAIAEAYKMRWQIELLFRWIKQHLKLRKFLGRSQNAVRLQLIAAMIAYLLLRIAARQSRSAMPAIRFAQLVAGCLFARKPLDRIDKPPEVHPAKARSPAAHNQREFCYV
jgi:putative transposase